MYSIVPLQLKPCQATESTTCFNTAPWSCERAPTPQLSMGSKFTQMNTQPGVSFTWSTRAVWEAHPLALQGIKKAFLYFKECCYKVALLILCVLHNQATPCSQCHGVVQSFVCCHDLTPNHWQSCCTIFSVKLFDSHCTRHGCSFVIKIQEHPLSSLADFFIMFTSAIQSLGSRAVQNLDSRLHYA